MNNVEGASKYGEAPPRNICANILKDCTNMGKFATGLLPNKHALNQKVARARKKLSQEPPLPRDLVTDLELLDDQFVYINKGERFLLCNEIVGEEGRILVFMSKDGKQVLEESTESEQKLVSPTTKWSHGVFLLESWKVKKPPTTTWSPSTDPSI